MLNRPPAPSHGIAALYPLRPLQLDAAALEEELEAEIVADRFLWRRKATSRRLQKCRIHSQEKAPDFAPRFAAPRLKSHAPEFDQSLAELIGHILPVRSPEALRRERALIVSGCILTALLATASAAVMIRGPEVTSDSPALQMSRAESGARQEVLHYISKTEAASTLLADFLRAETAVEKAPLLMAGGVALPALQEYYSRHPDEPPGFTCTNTSTATVAGREFYFIGGVLENGAWIEAAATETDSGLKIDWPYLKGTGDQEWTSWIENHPPEPVSMRVLATPDDFYSGPFSNAEAWLCVKITDLAGTSAAWAYIARDSDDGRTLARRLTNRGEPLRLCATFAFPSPLPSGAARAPQVRICRVSPRGWLADAPPERACTAQAAE